MAPETAAYSEPLYSIRFKARRRILLPMVTTVVIITTQQLGHQLSLSLNRLGTIICNGGKNRLTLNNYYQN